MAAFQRFTDEQCLSALRKHNGNVGKAGMDLGVGGSAISQRLRKLNKTAAEFYKAPTTKELFEKREEDVKGRDTAKQLRSALDEIEKLSGTIEHITGIEKEIQERFVRPPGLKKYSKDQSIMVAPLSDIHHEQRIERSKTLGRTENTPEISTKKLYKYYDQLPKFAKDISGRTSVKEVLLHPMLGDMINGNIHDKNGPGANWLTPQEAVEHLLPTLCGGIRYLLDSKQFERIVIPCCVGNHARSTKKPETELRVETSYEWPLYQRLRDHFRDVGEDRVEVIVPTEYFNRFMLPGGDSILFHHGDSCKGGDGVGGLLIPLQKYVYKKNSAPEVMARTVDRLGLRPPLLHVLGHFHQYIHSPGIIVNGSVIGAGGFAHSGSYSYTTPKQAVFVIHPEHGLTYAMPVILGD